jgi:purine nucleosidase
MPLYDPVAAALFLEPGLGTFRPARVDVEVQGPLTRGRTVIDTRRSAIANAAYLDEFDVAAVHALCMKALLA